MFTRLIRFLVVLLAVSPAFAEGGPPQTKEQMLADANNTFALDMYRQLATEKGNVFYSPYSVQSALMMTMAGAAGQTWGEMYCALGLPASRHRPPPGLAYAGLWSNRDLHPQAGALRAQIAKAAADEHISLSIANSIWPAAGFAMKDEFVTTLKSDYGVAVTPVAYPDPGRQTINTWVQKQTNDRIKNLLPEGSVDPLTRLVLVNAIYFKGDWVHPFDPDATNDQAFHLTAGEQVKVPMMYQEQRVRYAEDDKCQLVELRYKGGRLSMVVLLPREGQELDKFMAEVTADAWAKRIDTAGSREVRVYLPKFKLDYTKTLNEPLQAMGMKLAFTGQADLTGIADDPSLYISLVRHKAFIEVNETGSEAAAATAVAVMTRSAQINPTPPPVFRADRPFVYAIRDVTSGAILFMGRLADPRG